MPFAVLADEHVERRVATLLSDWGHDVVLVVDALEPSVDDEVIAAYARETDRLILTSDTDFLTEYGPGDHAGVLFQPDDELRPYRVASIVDEIASHLPQSTVSGGGLRHGGLAVNAATVTSIHTVRGFSVIPYKRRV